MPISFFLPVGVMLVLAQQRPQQNYMSLGAEETG